MSKRVFVFINGILTWPGSVHNWTARAEVYFQCYHEQFAVTMEYLTLPSITRFLFQRMRARKLQEKIQQFIHRRGWEIVLVGHSNGCDAILDCLRIMDWPRVEELHLISAACDEDFDRNGLNQALCKNLIGKVHWYRGGKDWALWFAHNWFSKRVLGYGTLGRTGPTNLDPLIPQIDKRIIAHEREDFGHSSWFTENNFARTMGMILGL